MVEYGEAGSAGSSVSGGVFPPLVRHDLQLLGIRHLPACGIYPLLVGSRAYEDGAKWFSCAGKLCLLRLVGLEVSVSYLCEFTGGLCGRTLFGEGGGGAEKTEGVSSRNESRGESWSVRCF